MGPTAPVRATHPAEVDSRFWGGWSSDGLGAEWRRGEVLERQGLALVVCDERPHTLCRGRQRLPVTQEGVVGQVVQADVQ